MVDDDSTAGSLRLSAIGVVLLALVLGLNQGSRVAVAFGAAGGGLLLALFLYPRLGGRSLRVRRALPDHASEDDDVAVTFTIENKGPLPLAWVVVEDVFAPDRAPRKPLLGGTLLAPGGGRVVRYAGNCFGKRGAYAIGPALARVHDPLGLFPVARRALGTSRLVVLPTVDRLPQLPSGGTGVPLAGGARSLRLAGQSSIPLGVRELRPGDPLRRVHWPATARRGRLMIVEHELEAAGDVAIVLDLSRASLRGLGRRSTLETAVRIAASAAAHHLRRGDRVSLRGQGREPLHVPPGSGEGHLARVLDALAHVRPDGEVPHDRVIRDVAPEIPPGSAVLVVLANLQLGVDRVVQAIAHLRARGVAVSVVLLDDASFLRIFDEQARRPEETVRLAQCADALLGEGATVFTVAQGDDLGERLMLPYAGPTRIKIDLRDLAEASP